MFFGFYSIWSCSLTYEQHLFRGPAIGVRGPARGVRGPAILVTGVEADLTENTYNADDNCDRNNIGSLIVILGQTAQMGLS